MSRLKRAMTFRKTLALSLPSLLATLLVISRATDAGAQALEVGPADDVEGAINALQPGDELVLQGGTYTLTDRFSFDLSGTADAPIVIRAKDGERPHFHREGADQNLIDIDGAHYVVLRGIEFSGGSAGLRISQASFFTIEDCEIHDTGDVALRANDEGSSYDNLRILRNNIHHTNGTGEGMYLGCNSNGCRLSNSLIEGNWVHHTNQAGVEQGDGIEIKEGSFGNVIRDNVVHDTNYPCILTYSTVGNGPVNVIERNVLWNCGDHGIQSAADATIRNNIILGSNSDGIAMQPHQSGNPSNLTVVHNTVLHPINDAISLRGAVGPVVIANNAVYAQAGNAIFVNGDTTALVLAGNVGVGGVSGATGGYIEGDLAVDFVNGHYDGVPPIDLFPAPGSALIAAGDAAHAVEDDFNGTPRNATLDVGAYVFAASGNPGAPIGEGFKPGGGGAAADGGSAGSPNAGGVANGGANGAGGDGAGGDAVGGATAAGGAANTAGNVSAMAGSTSSSGATSGASASDDAGCGCRLAQGTARAPMWPSGVALVIALLRRRTRRRPAPVSVSAAQGHSRTMRFVRK
jgi:hypothetical protein